MDRVEHLEITVKIPPTPFRKGWVEGILTAGGELMTSVDDCYLKTPLFASGHQEAGQKNGLSFGIVAI
jgi:hypothetical protein